MIGWDGTYVMNGMVKGFYGEYIYEPLEIYTPSRHLTIVFNLFVFFQIFNMLAARKINDEKNIFDGIFTNIMFMTIWVIILVGQFLIVTFGSKAMKCHIAGLTGAQWIWCVLISAVGLVWNLILKFIPDTLFPKLGDETEEDIRVATADYAALQKIADHNRINLRQ